jgi:hypothetical protein
MSAAEGALPPGPLLPNIAAVTSAAPYRPLMYAACAALALLCNYLLGVDVEWDTLDYHLYAGLSAVHDRFAQDYFAAGPASYFNPYAYAPFYLLAASGLPALVGSSVLALGQSTVLWLTYELALCACPSTDRRIRLASGLCAVALAFCNPILIRQFGSSFADITTAALVLCGWLWLACAVRAPRASLILGAGLILGAATALKLTNAVHAAAAVVLVLMLPVPLVPRVRYGLGFAGSTATGFAVVAAPWAWRLVHTFGNPFFPLLNGIFRSPEFTTEPLRHFRFVPGSLADALWRPFAIADPAPLTQAETLAADARYAVLVLLILFIAGRWLARNHRHEADAAAAAGNTRVLAALGCGLALDWALWLFASGNGRYFLPMACVAAVVIVALLFREFAASPKVRNYLLTVILAAQCLQLWYGSDYRWAPLPWGGPWFQVTVPGNLATEPNLYLTIGMQSNSFIAPYLAPDSGLVNFSGGYALEARGTNGVRIAALIRRYSPHVRMLMTGKRLYGDQDGHGPLRSDVDEALEPFGVKVDDRDCESIIVRGVPPPIEVQAVGNGRRFEPQSRDTTHLVTCRLVPGDPADRAASAAARRDADVALDHLEDACPELFQPRRLETVHDRDKWEREYVNTDLLAWVSHGEVKFRDLASPDDLVRLGSAGDWARAPQKLACGRNGRHYFARLLPSTERP